MYVPRFSAGDVHVCAHGACVVSEGRLNCAGGRQRLDLYIHMYLNVLWKDSFSSVFSSTYHTAAVVVGFLPGGREIVQ